MKLLSANVVLNVKTYFGTLSASPRCWIKKRLVSFHMTVLTVC